jgi:hypothetical protein
MCRPAPTPFKPPPSWDGDACYSCRLARAVVRARTRLDTRTRPGRGQRSPFAPKARITLTIALPLRRPLCARALWRRNDRAGPVRVRRARHDRDCRRGGHTRRHVARLRLSDFSSATVAVPASTSSLLSLTSGGPSGGKVVAAFGRLHSSEATSPSSAGTSAPETRGRLLTGPTGAPPASAVRGRASKRLAAGRKTNGAAGSPGHSTTSNSVDNQRVLAA